MESQWEFQWQAIIFHITMLKQLLNCVLVTLWTWNGDWACWSLEVCGRMVWNFGVEDGVLIACSWLLEGKLVLGCSLGFWKLWSHPLYPLVDINHTDHDSTRKTKPEKCHLSLVIVFDVNSVVVKFSECQRSSGVRVHFGSYGVSWVYEFKVTDLGVKGSGFQVEGGKCFRQMCCCCSWSVEESGPWIWF